MKATGSCALLAVAGAALFALLSLTVWLENSPPGYEAATVRAFQHGPWWFEFAADTIRFATATETVLVAGVALLAVLAFRRAWLAVAVLAGLLVLMPVVQGGTKDILDRPRPSAADDIEVRGSQTSPSFPAGHVLSPAALYGFAAFLSRRRWAIAVLAALLAASGWANLYLGTHWPTDLLGGAGAGLALAALAVCLLHAARKATGVWAG